MSSGCALIDVPPARAPLEDRWRRWMLTEHYARWDSGKETVLESYATRRLEDDVASYPEGAPFTRYGIAMRQDLYNEGPGWEMEGGLVGRVAAQHATVSLFGREVRRVHRFLFAYGFAPGRDFSYDFFLVVRPDGAPARMVREWHFPARMLALSGEAIDQSLLLRSTRSGVDVESFLHPAEGEIPRHLVDGFLDFDAATNVATVSVSGLKQPFSETVDLSADLGR